jgi:hypothetical protein
MPKETDSLAGPDAAPDNFDLGTWLGRRQAFGAIAGRCSAAEAECLRRIRHDKLYKGRAEHWSDFCTRHLNMTKQNADRIIRLLEEFGPAYFQLSQITRISPETYRQIASAVSEEGLRVHGDIIALEPSNSEKLAAAVAQLRAPKKPEVTPTGWDRLATAQRQFESVTGNSASSAKGLPGDPTAGTRSISCGRCASGWTCLSWRSERESACPHNRQPLRTKVGQTLSSVNPGKSPYSIRSATKHITAMVAHNSGNQSPQRV